VFLFGSRQKITGRARNLDRHRWHRARTVPGQLDGMDDLHVSLNNGAIEVEERNPAVIARRFGYFEVGCGAGDRRACRGFVVLITVEMRMLPQ
jgi:hypothetical protein